LHSPLQQWPLSTRDIPGSKTCSPLSGRRCRDAGDMPEWLRAEMPPPKRRERLPPPAQQVSLSPAHAESWPLFSALVLRLTHSGAVLT
jgi:hypothetical protein